MARLSVVAEGGDSSEEEGRGIEDGSGAREAAVDADADAAE